MNIYWKELIDIIWTIIKISEKKEDVFVYLDLILIIILEREREREREGKIVIKIRRAMVKVF